MRFILRDTEFSGCSIYSTGLLSFLLMRRNLRRIRFTVRNPHPFRNMVRSLLNGQVRPVKAICSGCLFSGARPPYLHFIRCKTVQMVPVLQIGGV